MNGVRYRLSLWPECAGRVRSRSVAYLDPNLAAVIHHLKYRGRRKAATRLGHWMARVALSDPGLRSSEAIVPVPMRAEKTRERGYNPAALLAGAVSGRVGIPVLGTALTKIRSTRSQTELSPLERTTNVRGSFAVGDQAVVSGMRLILVDDVLTSGSTVAAAADMLLSHGAGGVRVLTAALALAGRREG